MNGVTDSSINNFQNSSAEGWAKTYIAIDLKSFYASVECVERGLDPLTTNLVVADASRTEKTICLAVTPSLKAYGLSGRSRLFEVVQKAKEVKRQTGKDLNYITAVPRMSLYIKYSADIYEIYLKYFSPEDIHVYSIDEVFIDVTSYLKFYKTDARTLCQTVIHHILRNTGITATCGIAPNLFLCKVAMDIVAKHSPPDKYGVRIAELDEKEFRRTLWNHQPLTDFWRIGPGTQRRLNKNYMFTLGDVARRSLTPLGLQELYKTFGIDAEILIDHAWGYEPCTIEEAKAYTPENRSLSTGQVLKEPYTFEKARVIVWEMLELLSLDLVEKHLVTNQIVLTVGYDIENLTNPEIASHYKGSVTTDHYGRKVPKHAHGTANIGRHTSSTRMISEATLKLYDEIVDKKLLVRRVTIAACNLVSEKSIDNKPQYEQLDLFTDYDELIEKREKEELELQKERKIQEAMLDIKQRYGKNAILKGTNLQEGATTIERNKSIGGHKA